VVFDMDGTLTVPRSCWVEIHKAFGSNNDKGLERYLQGEISDSEFLELDLQLWREALGGGPVLVARVMEVLDGIPLAAGAIEAIRAILTAGLDVVILTGGLDWLVNRIIYQAVDRLNISSDEIVVALDHCGPEGVVTGREAIGAPRVEIHANRLVTDEGGSVIGQGLVGVIAKDKGTLFTAILERRGIEPIQAVAIGDGPVDIVLLRRAGLGVAVPKSHPRVVEAADVQLERDLLELIPLIGL